MHVEALGDHDSAVASKEIEARPPFLRRRRFLIEPKLQLGLLGAFLAGILAFSAALTFFLFAPAALALMGKRTDSVETLRYANQVLALDASWWPALGMSLVVILLVVLRATHRIAGPLHRFRCVLRDIERTGAARPFKLRRGDRLKTEAALLNAVITRLTDDLSTRRDLARRLRRSLEKSCANADAAPPVELCCTCEDVIRALVNERDADVAIA